MAAGLAQFWRATRGAALAAGAVPLGLLLVRWWEAGVAPATDVAHRPVTYAYVWASATLLAVGVASFFHRRVGVARQLSVTDPLTGLFNRRHFSASLLLETEHDRSRGLTTCVLCLDLDRFKALNDRYGHGRGDAALVAVARALSVGLRHRDVVARFGGDEFAILLPGTGAQAAVGIAERILAALNSDDSGFNGGLSASIGVAEVERAAESADVMEAADRALYWAKRAGGGRVALAPREPRRQQETSP